MQSSNYLQANIPEKFRTLLGALLIGIGCYIFYFAVPIFISFINDPEKFVFVKSIMQFDYKTITMASFI